MEPVEDTSTERTTTASEEGAEKTAQAAALKGLLKESILEVIKENPTILSTSTGKDPKESTSTGKISAMCDDPTGLGVGGVQSHWAGSWWWISLGWELVVDLTGLRSWVPGVSLGQDSRLGWGSLMGQVGTPLGWGRYFPHGKEASSGRVVESPPPGVGVGGQVTVLP